MIIDADCHISPTKEGGNSLRAEELVARMDRSGVAKAVIWLQPPYQRHLTAAANDYVAESAARFPDRLLPFGWADPNLGVEVAVEEARRGLDEHGFLGIKLNGAQNGYRIDDPNVAMPVVDEVAERGAVLGLHVGADAYDNTHPSRVATIARRHPELRILVIHMGGVGVPDLTRPAIDLARDFPNVTLIASKTSTVPVLRAIHELGANRVCFGSDTPFELMHVELARFRALMDGEVSPGDQAMVLGETIARVLQA